MKKFISNILSYYEILKKDGKCYQLDTAAAAAKLFQSCPTLCDPIDGSPPGSSVHGIFQARVLEWGTIAFSNQPHRTGEKRDFILKGCSQTFMCIGTQGKSSNLIGAWAKATCWPWGVSWRGRGSWGSLCRETGNNHIWERSTAWTLLLVANILLN